MTTPADVLLGDPVVLVCLLNELPVSLEYSTWDQANWPGYTPTLAVCNLLTDQRPNLILFEIPAAIRIPPGQVCPPFFGVVSSGRGICFGPFVPEFSPGDGLPASTFLVRIPVLFQYFVPA